MGKQSRQTSTSHQVDGIGIDLEDISTNLGGALDAGTRVTRHPRGRRQAASVVIILPQRTNGSLGQQLALLQHRHHPTPREREVMELLIAYGPQPRLPEPVDSERFARRNLWCRSGLGSKFSRKGL